MGNTKYAFIDEFGAFGFDFENEGCSTHFIISAIIVDKSNLEIVKSKTEEIRIKYFQTGEIKSSKIKNNHQRRILILNQLKDLPFNIFLFVCDKRKIYENSGLRFKKSFYKFLNNFVYTELRVAFSNLIICADQMGSQDFLISFAKYIKEHEIHQTLFDESQFRFEDSKKNSLVQIADIISGSFAYHYDERKKKYIENYDYKSLLSSKILRIVEFPHNYDTFDIGNNDINPQYDPKIAEIAFRYAKAFLNKHTNTDDIEIKQQIAILNYLLFRFMNKSPRKYIPTKELINQLVYLGYEKLSTQTFRNKIIAKLRDNDVIISSSKEGYKIPSSESELYDFVNHGKSIIMPMLSRLKKCKDIIKLGSDGKIDLFEKAEYAKLKEMLDD